MKVPRTGADFAPPFPCAGNERDTYILVGLIDGHAHFYPMFRPEIGLDVAASCFRDVRTGEVGSEGPDCLIVTDPATDRGFIRLVEGGVVGWKVKPAGPKTLLATRESDSAAIVLIAARQVRTTNGLEVLAYFASDEVPEAPSLETAVETVLETGGVPVIPWGFGKWWGKRGREVRNVLSSSLADHLFVADTATRPRQMPPPYVLRLARERGIPILAGTDPLPLPGEERRLARYGFAIDGLTPSACGSEGLQALFRSRNFVPRLFGEREGTISAIKLQLQVRFRALGSL